MINALSPPYPPSLSYECFHDGTNGERVWGWAWNKHHPDDTVAVDIYDFNVLIAQGVTADKYRSDIPPYTGDSGCHAFEYELPASSQDGRPHLIRVTISQAGIDAYGTPKVIRGHSTSSEKLGNARQAEPEPNNQFPIFILGTARSGTTLLQRILNSIDGVYLWGEHGGFLSCIADAYFLSLEHADRPMDRLSAPELETILSRPVDAIALAREFLKDYRRWQAWTNWYHVDAISDNFRGFIESFFNPIAAGETLCWGFKEHRYGVADRVIELLGDLYPEARFVFIVRNPFDVVLSHLASFNAQDVIRVAETWTVQNNNLLNYQEQNPKRARVIRYEDLVSRVADLAGLLDWIGFTCTEKQLSIIAQNDGRGARPFEPAPIDESLRQEIEKMTETLRIKLGY